MAVSFVNYGAVYAKILSMYGKRLRSEDFEALLTKNSVADVVHYLKTSSAYSELLKNVDERMIHRGQLEDLLSLELVNQNVGLYSFLDAKGEKIMLIPQLKAEIDSLLMCIRHLLANRDTQFFFPMNQLLLSHSKLPFSELSACKNIEQFRTVISGTSYGKLLVPLLADPSKLDYTLIENTLYADYFSRLCAIYKKIFDRRTSDELCEYLGTLVDIYNLLRLYRIKKYYPEEDAGKVLLPGGSKLKGKLLDSLVSASSTSQYNIILSKTSLKKYFDQGAEFDENFYLRYLKNFSKKIIHSGLPNIKLIPAFLNLKEIELHNLTQIIEGIRYGLPAEKIKKQLIG